MVLNATISIVIASLFLCAGDAAAQSVEADKEIAVVEVGAAASQSLTGGGSSFGPDLAVEVTPVENWLELEAGVYAAFRSSLDRMGCRSSVQEALDALEESGVYGGRWPGVGSRETNTG